MPPLGIPNRANLGDVARLPVGSPVLFLKSLHEARRAGRHYDIRMGVPQTGLLSWATRKEIPQEPGRSIALYQQPVHSWKYQDFSGEIPKGYGAGYVHPAEKFDAILHKVEPDGIIFSIQTDKGLMRFQLKRIRQSGSKPVWYLINITPRLTEKPEKLHYKIISEEEANRLINEIGKSISSIQPKIDGALGIIHINNGKIEVYSHRTSTKTGYPILHTERIFQEIPTVQLPKNLNNVYLLGEIYAVQRRGNEERVLSPVELSALLNSGLARSKEKQKELGVEFRIYVFDAVRMGDEDEEWQNWYQRPYENRKEFINRIIKYLPPQFHAPIEAKTPEDAKRLLYDIKKRVHPLTQEGLVFFPNVGVPMKLKMTKEKDVYIRELVPGKGKYKGRGVGGFRFSETPEGPILGTVGTGFDDLLREEMFKNPEKFIGRKARVRFQEEFPSGALRAPSLISLHEG